MSGGAADVIDALAERASTLGFPTHSYCYPISKDCEAPLFDPRHTPSRNGVLTELFRSHETTVRSIHATHSLAFSGPVARQMCNGHYLAGTPCGLNTPYDRLVHNDASVLLFGVDFHSYTLFHTAEDAASSQYAYELDTVDRLRVLDESGRLVNCESKRQSRTPRRFRDVGDHLVKIGLAKRTALGRSWLLFVPSVAQTHEFLVSRLHKTPDYLCASCSVDL